MPFIRVLGAVSLVLFSAGCSVGTAATCRSFRKNDPGFTATMDSCAACVDRFGPDNIDAVKGCAFALDAARLFGGPGR